MTDQIVITEKSSQAKDVRAALGNRYGTDPAGRGASDRRCVEPEEVNPDWKRWMPVLLRPEGLFGTKPATGGNKASKLKAIIGSALARPGASGLLPTATARAN